MNLNEMSYEEREKIFYRDVERSFKIAFQCSCCKKVFRRINIKSYDTFPLKFPILKYSTPGNNLPVSYELNFCSLDCLNSLLKNVPFGFEILAPVEFYHINFRDKYFYRDWEILD